MSNKKNWGEILSSMNLSKWCPIADFFNKQPTTDCYIDDCRRNRQHQCCHHLAKLHQQRRSDTGHTNWSRNVMERTSCLCQVALLVPDVGRTFGDYVRTGTVYPWFLE